MKQSSSILCFTPSPTLDLGGNVKELRPNEKSYVHDQTKSPGGNGINVSRILTRLKNPVTCSGFLGGSTGDEIKSLLQLEGVHCHFIPINGHSRISVTVSNLKDHQQTRLSFPGPKILRPEKTKFLNYLKQQKNVAYLVIGGSLPQGISPHDLSSIIKYARAKNIFCVVDCPGKILQEVIKVKPFFIKPNLVEFQELTNSKVTSLKEVLPKARILLKSVSYICISSVEDGALLVSPEGSYFGRIPKVKIRSTVGAGDSMVGSMTAQLYKGNSSTGDLLRWGLAASAATLETHGTELGSLKRIRELYEKTRVKPIDSF